MRCIDETIKCEKLKRNPDNAKVQLLRQHRERLQTKIDETRTAKQELHRRELVTQEYFAEYEKLTKIYNDLGFRFSRNYGSGSYDCTGVECSEFIRKRGKIMGVLLESEHESLKLFANRALKVLDAYADMRKYFNYVHLNQCFYLLSNIL